MSALPIHIASGGHGNKAKSARCANEWRYYLCKCQTCTEAKANGLLLTDRPPCSPATFARLIPIVNDRLSDDGRQRLASRLPLIPSVDRDADPAIVLRVERRMALWLARSVEHLAKDARVQACNDTTERFLAGTATEKELRQARVAAYAYAYAYAADAADAAVDAAAYAAYAAAAAAAAADADAAAAAAADAAAATGDDSLLEWLDRVLDAWAKIAAEEGLLGSCGWINPDEFVQVGGS